MGDFFQWMGTDTGSGMFITAAVMAVNCALCGTFLVLRRMSMTGDAISHSILPGVVGAFLFAGKMDSVWVMVGAAVAGMLVVFFIEWLGKLLRVRSDAATGVVFTGFFAVGLVMVRVFAGKIDLDPECVLMGQMETLPFFVRKGFFPEVALPQFGVLVLLVLVLLLGWRRWVATAFDEELAQMSGLRVMWWRQLLMCLSSLVVVSAFQLAGAVLAVALLVVPGATAVMCGHRVASVLSWSVVFSLLGCLAGLWLAFLLDANPAASMVLAGGAIFTVVWVVTGRRGA